MLNEFYDFRVVVSYSEFVVYPSDQDDAFLANPFLVAALNAAHIGLNPCDLYRSIYDMQTGQADKSNDVLLYRSWLGDWFALDQGIDIYDQESMVQLLFRCKSNLDGVRLNLRGFFDSLPRYGKGLLEEGPILISVEDALNPEKYPKSHPNLSSKQRLVKVIDWFEENARAVQKLQG